MFNSSKKRIEKYKEEYRKMSPEERQAHFNNLEHQSVYGGPFQNKAIIEMCKAAMAVDEEEK